MCSEPACVLGQNIVAHMPERETECERWSASRDVGVNKFKNKSSSWN